MKLLGMHISYDKYYQRNKYIPVELLRRELPRVELNTFPIVAAKRNQRHVGYGRNV
jgi:hypothetical protein